MEHHKASEKARTASELRCKKRDQLIELRQEMTMIRTGILVEERDRKKHI